MIELRDTETGVLVGSLTEAQLKFLVDQFEEESLTDQDYYIDADTVAMLEDAGADRELLALLRAALKDREGMEVRWRRA
jgi:processive 1,2-diacylglycerol beta-glucosyltransferase